MSGHLSAHLVGFTRQLRRSGVRVTSQQAALLIEALTHVGLDDPETVRDAARATLASRREDVAVIDTAFDSLWKSSGLPAPAPVEVPAPARRAPSRRAVPAEVAIARRLGHAHEDAAELVDRNGTWSEAEILRVKRFDRLSADEAIQVVRLMARMPLPPPARRTRRYRPAARGRAADWRRTIRAAVRHDGEIIEQLRRRRRHKPRPLVVFADVSGSMERYARMLLVFLHGLVQRSRRAPERWSIEAFVFGTRLTRITRALQARHAEAALDGVSRTVVDWSGGTRIGESFHAFNRLWGRRLLGRGALVAIISDGWDQGDPNLVGRELARLRRSCRRVYWLNPLAGVPGYTPSTAGLVAARPFIDAMLPAGHLSALAAAVRAIGREDVVRHRRIGA